VSQKCCPPFYFFNNCQKLTDFNDYWCVKSGENLTSKIINVTTSRVSCSHFTLGNTKKSFSTLLLIRTSDYVCDLRIKQTVTDTWFIFFSPTRNCSPWLSRLTYKMIGYMHRWQPRIATSVLTVSYAHVSLLASSLWSQSRCRNWAVPTLFLFSLEQKSMSSTIETCCSCRSCYRFLFIGTVYVTFLAWPLLWEIHTELCITMIVQFPSSFLRKSGNARIRYKENP